MSPAVVSMMMARRGTARNNNQIRQKESNVEQNQSEQNINPERKMRVGRERLFFYRERIWFGL